ncbi:MAG: hypothetical protein DRP64_14545, partial [Verrucomicrobia bacterium]
MGYRKPFYSPTAAFRPQKRARSEAVTTHHVAKMAGTSAVSGEKCVMASTAPRPAFCIMIAGHRRTYTQSNAFLPLVGEALLHRGLSKIVRYSLSKIVRYSLSIM